MFDASKLIELTLEEATTIAKLNLKVLRVVEQNGETLILTQDHKFNRINICVTNNYVTNVKGIG